MLTGTLAPTSKFSTISQPTLNGMDFDLTPVDLAILEHNTRPVATITTHMRGLPDLHVFPNADQALHFWAIMATNRDATDGDRVQAFAWVNVEWVRLF